jgi:hypothetical protein
MFVTSRLRSLSAKRSADPDRVRSTAMGSNILVVEDEPAIQELTCRAP